MRLASSIVTARISLLAVFAALGACAAGCKRESTSGETPGGGAAASTTPSVSGSVHRSDVGALEREQREKSSAASKSASSCGSVHVGGRVIPLRCRAPGWVAPRGLAGKLLIARKELNTRAGFAGLAELPASVDHRRDGTEGPIREQGEVGACTAFSLAGAMDHAVATSAGTAGSVSTLHLWSRYGTGYKEDATSGNLNHPVALEASWPWNASEACRFTAATDCADVCPGIGGCGSPDAPARDKADAVGVAKLTRVTAVDTTTDAFREVLAKGQDVWFGMAIDPAKFESLRGKDATSPDFDARTGGSGHAMTAVGYRTDPLRGTYFLLKNSWSKEWGDQGYAWMSESTLMRNLDEAYVVEASAVAPTITGAPAVPAIPSIPGIPSIPATPTPATPSTSATPTAPASAPSADPSGPPSDPGPSPFPAWPLPIPIAGLPGLPGAPSASDPGCGATQVADVLSGACVKPCSDGSAPFGGVCAIGGGCPKGFASILGLCVPAAPDKSGEGLDGIKYDCGLGGCVYSIPKGAHGCMTAGGCKKVCPAPRFLLASGATPAALVCSE